MSQDLPLVPAIQWYEGMLLSPQHFQQLELRSHQILTAHLKNLSPHHWGIIDLEFDSITLPTGLLRINHVKVIMPDGLIVDYTAKPEALQLQLDLSPFQDALMDHPCTVYLCIPEMIQGSSPITGEWPRYIATEGDDVLDYNAADNVIHMPRLQPKLSLIVADAPPARYTSIPIAKLDYSDEVYSLAPYMAPCFTIPSRSPLGEKCAKMLRRFREKAAFLSEKWQTQIGTPLVGETSAQLKPIVESLPLLEPLLHAGKAHPEEIHRTLCMVAGKMSTLRLGQIPPVFPSYNHNEILNSCLPLLEWSTMIAESLEKAFSVVLFGHQENYFSVKLQPEILTQRLMIGLKGSSTLTERELIDWMKDAIIVSESMLESVRVRRIVGAPRQVMDNSEINDLMPGRDIVMFGIKTDNAFVSANERLYIFNPADIPEKRPSEAVLYLRHSELSRDIVKQIEEAGI
ncbi:MAG: type VI secretion system baseplate subunit TssK [Candidatus Paracaedibacteraceae bacterium]|nr:type VI secretion system baseplate subunit TssK [Candidatus Paracaedibacteraceae bacterium]